MDVVPRLYDLCMITACSADADLHFRIGLCRFIGYLWVICHHFFSPGIKLNEFGLGLGLVTTFFLIYSLGDHSCNTNPNPNPNPNPNSF